ncbi:hypothetical protein [Nocardiopsis composta]|uniref:Uncharacterized protein n=1 Tax=Nocardiopsis composta TaxID=157465 RepID=A0A7W8VDJ1_9ACTN|nr:hypothetical protein [Nocardiopsis composta]MBB5432312.1 hypothetical protein [Nocardiopsis composta]
MAKQNLRPRTPRRAVGSTVLGAMCAGGALVWAFIAGVSLMPASTPAEEPQGSELDMVSDSSADAAPEAVDSPEGRLQIQVSSEDRAYIQNLTCTGDAVADPALCRELASIAAEQEEEAEEQETGVGLFDEVPEEAVCDADRAYGPGEARITGEWEGEEVDTALNRADSCEEVRWQRLLPLLEPME